MRLIRHSAFAFTQLGTKVLAAGILLSVAGSALADSENVNTNAPGQVKKQSLTDRVQIISRDEDSSGKKKPEKPNRPAAPAPGADVQDLVKEFKAARETYLEQQKELARQVKENSKEAREALRQQNKELLEAIKEQQKALLKETKDRAKDLKSQLHPDMGRVIDSGVGEGRGR